MNSDTGEFEGLKGLGDKSTAEQARIVQLPTLAIGEIIYIKGVAFKVKHMKQNGRLIMRMVKKSAVPA